MDKQLALTNVTLDWQVSQPSDRHEFIAVENGDTYLAYRHRTDYGWSWFSITKNGQPSSINSGSQTTLPRLIQEWR